MKGTRSAADIMLAVFILSSTAFLLGPEYWRAPLEWVVLGTALWLVADSLERSMVKGLEERANVKQRYDNGDEESGKEGSGKDGQE